MISLAEAQARIKRDIAPLSTTSVNLSGALGLVLVEPAVAHEAIPPFSNSAMDGFAVHHEDSLGASADAPVALPVVATVAAGAVEQRPLGRGEAMRIMTGAPIPEGANAIIKVELTSVEPGEKGSSDTAPSQEMVSLLAEVEEGNHIRPAGDDVAAGVVILPAGSVITPGHIGVLATVGANPVVVTRRPRVGVFSTGDELVSGSAPLLPGQIRDSNRPTLLALVAEAGCIPVDLGSLPDNEPAVEAALIAAVDPDASEPCDALITSGGVSMGDFDFVKTVLSRLGDVNWMQVSIKPAKPLAFGLLKGIPIFGLPGNPVSSMVSFELFARPSLMAMMGKPSAGRMSVWAVSETGIHRRVDGKIHFMRVVAEQEVDGAWRVELAGQQGSHQLTVMAKANGLAVIPDGAGIRAGGRVRVILLDS